MSFYVVVEVIDNYSVFNCVLKIRRKQFGDYTMKPPAPHGKKGVDEH